ncbi:MAG: lysozyme [Nitrosomonadaceae bacterium]
MITSDDGLNIIKEFEQLRLKAYIPAPGDVPTIGWGTTAGVKMGDTIDLKTADQYLRRDVHSCEDAVSLACGELLTQSQFDACVSLTYNIGGGAFRQSTLVKKIKSHDPLAADEFLRWDKFQGVPLAGLTRRRKKERELFLKLPVSAPLSALQDSSV